MAKKKGEHLKKYHFKMGHGGGPGRPKKENTFSDTARELMGSNEISVSWRVNGNQKTLQVTSDKNMYYGVASALIMESLKGNVQAAKELIDRIEPKSRKDDNAGDDIIFEVG